MLTYQDNLEKKYGFNMRALGVGFIGSSSELKERVRMLRTIDQYINEIVIIYFETNDFQYALDKVKTMYSEYKEKDRFATDQSMQNDHDEITFLDIIPSGTDLDNGELYDLKTGQTIRDI